MKKQTNIALLLAIALVLPLATVAQKNWHFGIAVGGASSQWHFSMPKEDSNFNWTNLWGLHAAIPVEVRINDFLAIQGELGWTQKGAKAGYDYFPDINHHVQIDSIAHIHYIDFPLLLKVSTKPGKVQGFANAGFYFGYALKGEIIARTSTTDLSGGLARETITTEIDFEQKMSRTDIGLALGGGVQFKKLFFSVRYMHGSMNLDTIGELEEGTYNRSVVFSAGYFF